MACNALASPCGTRATVGRGYALHRCFKIAIVPTCCSHGKHHGRATDECRTLLSGYKGDRRLLTRASGGRIQSNARQVPAAARTCSTSDQRAAGTTNAESRHGPFEAPRRSCSSVGALAEGAHLARYITETWLKPNIRRHRSASQDWSKPAGSDASLFVAWAAMQRIIPLANVCASNEKGRASSTKGGASSTQ